MVIIQKSNQSRVTVQKSNQSYDQIQNNKSISPTIPVSLAETVEKMMSPSNTWRSSSIKSPNATAPASRRPWIDRLFTNQWRLAAPPHLALYTLTTHVCYASLILVWCISPDLDFSPHSPVNYGIVSDDLASLISEVSSINNLFMGEISPKLLSWSSIKISITVNTLLKG